MAIGSGIAAQVGIKAESTYGTPVTVDRFYEFNSESIKVDLAKVYSKGLRTARFQRADRVKTYIKSAAGSVSLDFLNKSMGLWFQHALGQDTVTGASANKTHTCIPDSLAQQGKFMTLQVGRPDVGGTVRAFTYEGGKITGWELDCTLDQVAKLTFNLDFENVLTATALASASYIATQEAFVFAEAGVTIGGTVIPVRSCKLKYGGALKTDRRFLGNTKKEPIANGEATIEIDLESEFADLTQYAAQIAGTQAAFVLTLTSATVIPTTAVPYSCTITVPLVEINEGQPNVGGPDVLMQSLKLKGLDDGTNPPISVVIVSGDAAP